MGSIKKTIYGKIRTLFPLKTRGYITKSLYSLNIKPTVNKKNKTIFSKGIVVLSADFEMAWAFRFSKGGPDPVKQGLLERENIPIIIKWLEKYNIPITWATVGHLFLESCTRQEGKIHPDMPRPPHFTNKNWTYIEDDWYQHDPGTDYHRDPAWYAPDLIDMILKSTIKHEIGCHTFSHIDFSEENCSVILAEKELLKCKQLAEEKGIRLQSMVFPGGTCGNYSVLKQENFISYRNPNGDYEIDLPFIDPHGLVAISSSLGLDKTDYQWRANTYIDMARKYIKNAARHNLVCHFWFHPSMDNWYLKNVFPQVLKDISNQREINEIEVLTMGQLASRILDGIG